MNNETLKLADLIAQTIVQLATLAAIMRVVGKTFEYLQHRLDVTGKPLFERIPKDDLSV